MNQMSSSERRVFDLGSQIFTLMARKRRADIYYRMFPWHDTTGTDGQTIYSRTKYKKHLEFFKAGAKYRERCVMAANRSGKTFGIGGYETVAHLTGEYPSWWEGKRFVRPIRAWAAGKTNETTRDIIQATLLGDQIKDVTNRKGFDGTGLIPRGKIGHVSFKKGGSDLADLVRVRHVSGGWSVLGFKSYEQGRGSFEGTAQHVIWLDEECPLDVYGEALIRTATTDGLVMLTFTPLAGMSETVLQFMPKDEKVEL